MASISKRKDGSWLGQINQNGKRKSFYGKTKKEVERKINEYTYDINTYGIELEKSKVILKDLVYKYLFSSVIGAVSASTFDRKKGIYDKYIKDSDIGKMYVTDIRQAHLQDFFNKLSNLATESIKKIKILLNGSFTYAIANNIIRINPIDKVIMPKSTKSKKSIEIFTIDEQKRYLETAQKDEFALLYILALSTGLRLGEIIALTWENIDLKNKKVYVTQSLNVSKVYTSDGEYEKKIIIKEPKSKKSKRDVPLPATLCDLLKENKSKGYVFTKDGELLNAQIIQRHHRAICKASKVPIIKFHSLRHTYATRLLELGESPKTVQEILGHEDIRTTLNIYAHVLEETKNKASEKLDALLFS